MKNSLTAVTFAATALAIAPVSGITVVSQAIEDGWLFNSTDRNEHILNHTGANTGRWSAVRFDSTILGSAVGGFTDASAYTLTSATLTLTERAARDGSNGTQSGRVGAAFYDTSANSGWTHTNLATYTWNGNTAGRPGRFGGSGAYSPTNNNVDQRSNGAADLTTGLGSPHPAGLGISWVNHTFVSGVTNETATIDLTGDGATFADIQSLLASWVGGNNAGMVLAGEFGNQSFWQSNGVASGNSVGSTVDGDSTNSGVSLEPGTGDSSGGLYLTLEFTPVPEPSVALLGGLGLLGLLRRRR